MIEGVVPKRCRAQALIVIKNRSDGGYSFEGVFDSRHPGPGAREGGSAREKMTQVFETIFVTRLILSPLAERRAPIDRGERDIESEPESREVRRDFGTCIFTLRKGAKADLNTVVRELLRAPFLHYQTRSDVSGMYLVVSWL